MRRTVVRGSARAGGADVDADAGVDVDVGLAAGMRLFPSV
jgi:hypothetical protein